MTSPAILSTVSTGVPPGDLDATRSESAPMELTSRIGRGQDMNGSRRQLAPAETSSGVDQRRSDTQNGCAGAVLEASEGGQDNVATHAAHATPSEALLLILADALDDLERQRIASENRLRSLRQVKGLEGSRAEGKLEELTEVLVALEHQATLEVRRAMRQHPLGAFVNGTIGLGEKQSARLLAATGDPGARSNPAKLWAYCGLHVIDGRAPKRRKGEQSNWSTVAKTRAYLCAESCMKQRRSPYRAIYERERGKWAERDTTDLHKHNHALRVVAKEILKDLWREARAIQPPAPIVATPALTAEGQAA